MYHSISIPYTDQMTHLYVWRDCKPDTKPKTFAITAVSMGDKPSACIAQISLQKTANEEKDRFPKAADTVLRNAYMDDVPGSVDTEEEAVLRMREIQEMLGAKGFQMKDWVYSGKMNRSTTSHDQVQARFITGLGHDADDETESVLGMQWNPQEEESNSTQIKSWIQK